VETHVLVFKRVEEFGDRFEVFEQAFTFAAQVDEDETTPDTDPYSVKIDTDTVECTLPVVAILNCNILALQIEGPTMIATAELVGLAAPICQAATTMRTYIVMRDDLARFAASNDDGIVADVVSDEVAGIGQFLLAAGNLLDIGPKLRLFPLKEIARDIVLGRKRVQFDRFFCNAQRVLQVFAEISVLTQAPLKLSSNVIPVGFCTKICRTPGS